MRVTSRAAIVRSVRASGSRNTMTVYTIRPVRTNFTWRLLAFSSVGSSITTMEQTSSAYAHDQRFVA
nr:hypothetical protein [Curtanaerobium respiraculi]